MLLWPRDCPASLPRFFLPTCSFPTTFHGSCFPDAKLLLVRLASARSYHHLITNLNFRTSRFAKETDTTFIPCSLQQTGEDASLLIQTRCWIHALSTSGISHR